EARSGRRGRRGAAISRQGQAAAAQKRKEIMMETDLTIVILAAGLGTRMKSAKAKVLHRAGGKTLIEHVVDTALQLTSPERIFVVVGRQADQVRKILKSRGVKSVEQGEQKGPGHG